MHDRKTGKLTGAVDAMYANSSGGDAGPSLAGIAALIQAAPPYEVWPENMPAINLYSRIYTQWRTGGMGRVLGLDYNVLFHCMDKLKLSEQDYEWMFDDIRSIESAAISIMNRKD